MPAPHARQRAREQVGRDGRDHAEPQRSAQRALERVRGLDEAARLREHRARAPHELVPGGREQHAPPVALEQAQVEQRLELADLGGEPGLRHAARARRAVEAAEIGDRDEILELAQRRRLDHANQ